MIELDYKPRAWAKELHETKARFSVLVCHRRSGKTTACINHLIREACRNGKSRYAYIAPYYKQAKVVCWDMLKEYARPITGTKFNESELRADFPNGSRISLYGADNPDNLRGIGLHGVVLDEYSQQPSSIFTEVIRPALSDHEGFSIWIGTPKGRNDFFRLYNEHLLDEEWLTVILRASESGIVAKGELEDARKTMTLDEYNQEFECSFDAAIKGAYYAPQLEEARRFERISNVPYQEGLKVETFWDLGMSDYTSILFVQRVGRELHIFDYYQNNNAEIDHYSTVLRKKGYEYGKHWLPWDARGRQMTTGKSIKDLVGNQLGKENIYITPNIEVLAGINMARRLFSRCWFDHKKCAELVDALSMYTQEWDDKKGMFKNKPLHNWASHAADAFRYLGVAFKEEMTIQSKPIGTKYGSAYSKSNPFTGSKPVKTKYSNNNQWVL